MNSNESIKMIDQKLIEYNLSYSLIKHKIQEDEKRYFVEKSDWESTNEREVLAKPRSRLQYSWL